MELQEIKSLIIDRVNKYDKHNIINPIEVEMCVSVKAILFYLFDDDYKVYQLIQDNVLNVDFLVSTFGDDALRKEFRIYTSGKHELFGTYSYYVLGDAKVKVWNDAHVFAYDNAEVLLYDNAELNAYDNVKFQANMCSKVYVPTIANVSGTLHWNAQGVLKNNHGHIEAYDNSTVKAFNSSNIDMYVRSTLFATESNNIRLMENSCGNICQGAIVNCYGNSSIQAKQDSIAYLFENSNGYFNDRSVGYCQSANQVTCRDYSVVEIYQNVKYTNLHGNSFARIMEMGTKLRAYNSSTVQDFADIYTEALDNAVIIWMGRRQIFKNQQKYSAEVPFEYTEEQKC